MRQLLVQDVSGRTTNPLGDAMGALTDLANRRFAEHMARLPGVAPVHRVEFSPRITTSWALIYYRRHLVRLSPYLFLLDAHELKHGTHWKELDATLRHEAAHAAHFARTGEAGHTNGFHELLSTLGVRANGGCDLGPENAAFRYVYACPGCNGLWKRRSAIHGNWSCGSCAPGRYEPAYRMTLLCDLGHPLARLAHRLPLLQQTLAEGLQESAPAPRPVVPHSLFAAAAAAIVMPE